MTGAASGTAPGDVEARLRSGRAVLLLGLWCGFGWLLGRLGGGPLGVPLGSSGELGEWLEVTEPAVLAAAVLRLVAMALCGYLVLVTVSALLASLAGWRPAATRAFDLMPLLLRRMVVGGTGVSLAGTLLSPGLAAAAPQQVSADRTAVMIRLEPDGPDGTAATTSTTTGTTSPPAAPSTTSPSGTGAVGTRPPASPSTSTTTILARETEPAGPAPSGPRAPAEQPGAEATTDGTWVVQLGDSFWAIAEEVVAEAFQATGDAPPSDADIARYWRTLVEANRDRLADRDNPDLLFPGQRLHLPKGT